VAILSKRPADKHRVTFSFGRTERVEQPLSEPIPGSSFDLVTLLDLFDGNTGEIAELLSAAIASIRSDAGAIAGAAAIDDRRTILESAHRLKGTSGTIGDRRLYAVSRQIEEAAADVPNPVGRLLLSELRAAVSVLSAEIAAFSLDA
jgi:HPt (histidine-containing phosphotransfer) domain-containing protein